MITQDYHSKDISLDELQDLMSIANVEISNISLEDYPNLLVFPDSFETYDKEFGKRVICSISADGKKLYTNSIVGFVGVNNTHLSIHSRFTEIEDNENNDFFLHYMLQKVANFNLLNLPHSTDEDSVFDFLVYLFPIYLKKAISQGIYKKYNHYKHNDANIKGYIDIARHIKTNIPFNGNVAYNTKEYSYDNDITQLVRHTIEYILKLPSGDSILSIDKDTQDAISTIRLATPTYDPSAISVVINKNLRPIAHPYYSEYTPLQRICLQILRHEELKYGQGENEIYGVLIDAAWLWEEYLSIILDEQFNHYLKDRGKRFYLFENFQQIIPDYLSLDRSIVADAKYIPLNQEKTYWGEKVTSIYYKTITYMYRFCSDKGLLFYPHPDEDINIIPYKIKTEIAGKNGGTITKVGLRIPSRCNNYGEFVKAISQNEVDFLDCINKISHP